MGLLDMMYVCGNCKKAVKTGINTICPECGSKVITKDAEGNTYTKVPSEWKAMSSEEQDAWVKALLDTRPAEESENKWEYDKFITTTETFVNGEIEEYLGIVTGTDIYLVGGLIGGGLANQENLVNNAMQKAKQKLMGKALALGGNAVVGTSFTMSSPGNANNMIVVLSGTAVKVKF